MKMSDDQAAILAVLTAETQAWLRRDLEALASHWIHSSDARRIASIANLGTQVQEGWEAIWATFQALAEQFPEPFANDRIHRERMNIVVNGDAAWATYDQIGEKSDDGFEMAGTQHEFKVLQRVEGQWKLSCVIVIQRAVDHEVCPLIEIGHDASVLWMNGPAHEQLSSNDMLILSGGKLRARNRDYQAGLQEAILWASRHARAHWTPEPLGRLERAVILGESGDSAPLFCWVLLEDGKILVSFNDQRQLKRRIELAQRMYGFSAAQAQLALIIAEGHDLSSASRRLGVGVNTLRTHLQRMFNRTGARSQSALIGLLLSAEAPTAR